MNVKADLEAIGCIMMSSGYIFAGILLLIILISILVLSPIWVMFIISKLFSYIILSVVVAIIGQVISYIFEGNIDKYVNEEEEKSSR